MNPNPPWVAIPTFADREEIINLLPSDAGIAVLRNDELGTVHASGEQMVFSEVGHWLVNIGPDFLWTLSKWALTTYAGKKVLETLATEVTKDLYKGGKELLRTSSEDLYTSLRKLADLSRNQTELKAQTSSLDPKFMIVAEGQTTEPHELAKPGLSRDVSYQVSIEFKILQVDSVDDVMTNIQQLILPLLGCITQKLPTVQITALPGGANADIWVFWHMKSPSLLYSIDVKGSRYSVPEAKKARIDPVIGDCFDRFGLTYASSLWAS